MGSDWEFKLAGHHLGCPVEMLARENGAGDKGIGRIFCPFNTNQSWLVGEGGSTTVRIPPFQKQRKKLDIYLPQGARDMTLLSPLAPRRLSSDH
ncbi:hypothetical protein NPIL_281661 [Nephila pilipes]|uniref:Uncharacterized protein n=1 Tax=Nephila pilipes TaxID=299642 RepID=A0A8X6P996_NEPPI|nr:hypothetical protein NPIL_281661 [Nephila pilipes]